MSLADLSPLANHLWQSTLFVAVIGLVVLSLKNNRAQVRYGLWLAASMKFLIPFATLVAIGRQFGWSSTTSIVQPDLTSVIDMISQPFARPEVAAISRATTSSAALLPTLLFAIWFCGCAMHLLAWWVRWHRIAVIVRGASPLKAGRELDALRRLELIVGTRPRIAAVTLDTFLEPGVFGVFSPVLIWPRTIGAWLADRQLDAILAHELCHVRRRDNLAVALHMVVEALFWFHPLVWWLEQRLVDERERACDEEVIRLGSEPHVYAESLLRTCEFYVESPLVCVTGVTGSDLKKRIEAIVTSPGGGKRLKPWKKFLLITVGAATVVAPVLIGVLNAPPLRAQPQAAPGNSPAFEVASVKQNKSGEEGFTIHPQPGGRITVVNAPLRLLIRNAYRLQDFQIVDGPSWLNSDRFDVVAKAEGNPSQDQLSSMLRTLLADRFKLSTHSEIREMSIYALMLARSDGKIGQQLRKAEPCFRAPGGGPPQSPPLLGPASCDFKVGPGTIAGRGVTMAALAASLSNRVGRTVVDRTSFTGDFDLDLKFTPESASPNDPAVDQAPSIFTALQEQLGLTLESTTGPVDVLVIDGVERPTPN